MGYSGVVGLLAWLLLVVLVVAVFGIGNILEAAFWLLVVFAVMIAALVFFGARAIKKRL